MLITTTEKIPGYDYEIVRKCLVPRPSPKMSLAILGQD